MYAYCNNHPVGTADYDGHVAVGASIALDLLLKLLIELVISAGCTYMIYEAVDSISGKQEQVPSYDELKNQSKQEDTDKHEEKSKEDSGETTETGIEGENDSNKVQFPSDPEDFNPEGLKKIGPFETKNGKIIKWIDENKKAVYEWDEDLRFGPHYHVIGDDGNTRLPNSTGETHFFPGDTFGK